MSGQSGVSAGAAVPRPTNSVSHTAQRGCLSALEAGGEVRVSQGPVSAAGAGKVRPGLAPAGTCCPLRASLWPHFWCRRTAVPAGQGPHCPRVTASNSFHLQDTVSKSGHICSSEGRDVNRGSWRDPTRPNSAQTRWRACSKSCHPLHTPPGERPFRPPFQALGTSQG